MKKKILLLASCALFAMNTCFAINYHGVDLPCIAYNYNNALPTEEQACDQEKEKILIDIIDDCVKAANDATSKEFGDKNTWGDKAFNATIFDNSQGSYILSDYMVRYWYVNFLLKLKQKNAELQSQEPTKLITYDDLARIASAARHFARVYDRHHQDPAEVKELESRDLEKYGNKDGPTYKYLYEKQKEKQRKDFDKIYSETPFTFDDKLIEEGGDFNGTAANEYIIEASVRDDKTISNWLSSLCFGTQSPTKCYLASTYGWYWLKYPWSTTIVTAVTAAAVVILPTALTILAIYHKIKLTSDRSKSRQE